MHLVLDLECGRQSCSQKEVLSLEEKINSIMTDIQLLFICQLVMEEPHCRYFTSPNFSINV